MSKNSFNDREDADWLEVSQRWLEVNKQLNALKEEYAFLKDQLISLAADESCQGGGVRLRKSMRKGMVQYGEIPELKEVDLEKYRKPATISWTLSAADSHLF